MPCGVMQVSTIDKVVVGFFLRAHAGTHQSSRPRRTPKVTIDSHAAEDKNSTPGNAGPPSLARSLLRLGLGGTAVGARVVRRPDSLLEELSSTQEADGSATLDGAHISAGEERFDAVLGTSVGTAMAAQRLVVRGVGKTVAVNRRVWNVTAPLRKPLDWIGVTGLVNSTAQMLAIQLDRLEQTGRVEILESREQALGALSEVIDSIVGYLGQSPAVLALVQDLVQQILPELADDPAIAKLVEEQVALILPTLADDPAVQDVIRKQVSAYLFYLQNHSEQIEALIRTQGDTYIEYLNRHPDNVQSLIQGQSLGLAGQVMDGVRERTVTADTVAEMFARRILGRTSRNDLPPPPREVIRRADATVIPSDFIRKENEEADGK